MIVIYNNVRYQKLFYVRNNGKKYEETPGMAKFLIQINNEMVCLYENARTFLNVSVMARKRSFFQLLI